jgi:bifunctional UDP-N-acetylglucosamine pyrophosphorylase / glucosamine-1-phosphate N-acetyltransferase
MSADNSVVILAAGMGTRMKSRVAKVLHRAGGLTLIEHVVRTARKLAPPENIVVVTGHQADAVEDTVAPYCVRTALQVDQLGTGHALRCAEPHAPKDGRLFVLYGDVPLLTAETLETLLQAHLDNPCAATVLTAVLDDPAAYGRILRAPNGDVEGIVEFKAASDEQRLIREINSGIYCFDAPLLWRHISQITTNNPAGEFYLTDIVEILRAHGHAVHGHIMADPNEMLGINTKIELAEVDRLFRIRFARRLMLQGVTIESPETVTIDANVTAAPDAHIEPGVRLLGDSHLGPGARIGAYSVIKNSSVSTNAVVEPFTYIDKSMVGENARVGPYARLRMHAVACEGVHIGNFVELKNSTMSPGAKANHLAYLGDAMIGENTNIGAGAITCNYDGKHKHPTNIGDRVFVGSNTTLVAPIDIEDDAYIAAGSTVTENVPPKSLAIARQRQTNKTPWSPKHKR